MAPSRFEDQDDHRGREFDVVKLGIGRTFQNPTVFDDLTVIENVDLAAQLPDEAPPALSQAHGRVAAGRIETVA